MPRRVAHNGAFSDIERRNACTRQTGDDMFLELMSEQDRQRLNEPQTTHTEQTSMAHAHNNLNVTNVNAISPKSPNIVVGWELVTPDIAAHYLTLNTSNRPLNRAHVRELADDLRSDRWIETHQGISFDTTGSLQDGQHRLEAIVLAETPAWLLVSRNVPTEAFSAIDQHRKRTAGQMLAVAGISRDAPRLAAMSRCILMCTAPGHSRPNNAEVIEHVVANQGTLGKYLNVARKFGPPVAAAFAWAELQGWASHETEKAAFRLVDTSWESGDDPMKALRKRLENVKSFGQGDVAIAAKFDVATQALTANHLGRGVRRIRRSDRVLKPVTV